MSRVLYSAGVFLLARSLVVAAPREVTFTNECGAINAHGVARWRAKTDASEPPVGARYIEAVTPSQMYSWIGPGIIPHGGWRTGNEVRWYALTGRVISIGAESDGDLHLVLVDSEGDKPGRVVVELPLGARWCDMRKEAFSWTNVVFPFKSDWRHQPFRLIKKPVITVIGHAFYDTDHSGPDIRNNKRPQEKDKAVWEIHPVMRLKVISAPTPHDTAPPAIVLPEPIATPLATSPPPQLATITQPVRISIPYGETVLPVGMKVQIISRSTTSLRVLYLGDVHDIPIAATDLGGQP